MKKLKLTSLVLAAAMALGLSACSGGDSSNDSADNGGNASADSYNVGVIQFGSHPSLDNCYAGIEQALKSSDIADKLNIDLQNGNMDSATCDTIAKNMAAKNYDIIYAIATPAAISAYAATANTDIPVIFCAVSDPVAAGIVEDMSAPGGNCTGTSDILDFNAQVSLIKALQPNVQKIGVLYTTSEANSISQLASLKEVAGAQGIEIVEQGVQGAADVPQAAATLAPKVDCINNFTDNNVVNNLTVVLEQADAAGIPVYGSEVEQVANGCLASISIDYVELGKVTGDMGIRVLKGESAGTIAVGQISEGTPVVNTEVMEKFSIELPEAYADAEKVTTNKAE
ncbi:MAG: ABC transporter substrate-binding protein [Ruminococcus sp.]|nr:ABC transporter substrate-binding protein [Ruminococcus sp.]MCM1381033.1 ABC transporter substrate-binding protein [Muribaculaceae bacterium]MCM1479207.1 ABC transporter substrate-binding protein [Muribaculaceae bacterium]